MFPARGAKYRLSPRASVGEPGLRTTADMNRLGATLRAYCVGYLVAQRETGEE